MNKEKQKQLLTEIMNEDSKDGLYQEIWNNGNECNVPYLRRLEYMYMWLAQNKKEILEKQNPPTLDNTQVVGFPD